MPQRPFPQHTVYTAETIKPNHLTQVELDEATAEFYDLWRAKYLKYGCDPDTSYVWVNADRDENENSGRPGAPSPKVTGMG